MIFSRQDGNLLLACPYRIPLKSFLVFWGKVESLDSLKNNIGIFNFESIKEAVLIDFDSWFGKLYR